MSHILNSPAFTGIPTAPTAGTGDNSTQLATTAFVKSLSYLSGTKVDSFNTRTGAVTLSSTDVTTALTFTPVNKAGDTGVGAMTFTGAITVGTVDAAAAGTLNLGTTNATVINLGTATTTQTVNIGTGSGVTTINIGGAGDTVNIAGTLNAVQTTNTTVADALITLNKGGAAGSGSGVGIEVEEGNSTITGYVKTTGDRTGWTHKAPANAGTVTLTGPTTAFDASFTFGALGAARAYAFPDASGTVALTTDIHAPVTLGTANGLSLSTQDLSLQLASGSTTGALSSTDWGTFNAKAAAGQTFYLGTTSIAINRTSGSIALTGITSIDGSAGSATNATNATNTAVTDDTTTNATHYVTFVNAASGNLPQKISSTKLTYNPSTGLLTSTGFSGSGASLTGILISGVSGLDTALSGKAATSQTFYLGTTSVAINRASAAIALTGITSIDGSAGSVANTVTFNNGGAGDASGTSFNGSATRTISYNTFGAQAALSGTGFVKISGTTISYDNSTYLTTSTASSTYAPLASPTFTGTPTLPTGTIATTQAAGNSSTAVATTAFVAAALAVEGSMAISTKTGAYTLAATDYCILVDATAGGFTVNLPAAPATGQIFVIKKIDSSANAVTVSGNAKNIDGSGSFNITAQYQSYSMIYNGTAWFLI